MQLPRRLQDLPPKWAHFCLGVERSCKKDLAVELGAGSLVCGCSGGADSTALLLLVAMLCHKNGGRVVCAHLDHALREESADEARHVADMCGELGVCVECRRVDVQALSAHGGKGLEETARQERYSFFEQVRAEHGAQWILTAHHLDDLCEDVLLRLTRGAGWPALGGMPARDDQRHVLRPLLLTPVKMLRDFLRALDVAWLEDASNQDMAYTRNRMRHEILPLFIRENPNFRENTARLWRQARLDEGHWQQLVESIEVQSRDGGLFVPRKSLLAHSPAARQRVYVHLLDRLGSGQSLAENVFALEASFASGPYPASHQFPGGKTALVTAQGILFVLT